MDILWAIITWFLFGLIAGAIARLLVPGRQSMGLLATSLLGIVGSFLGGFVAYLFTGGEPLAPSGFLMSLLGAVIVLLIAIRFNSRRRRTAL